MPRFESVGRVDRFDASLDSLIGVDAVVELLDIGFAWPEGPVWVARGGFLLFSDIPRNVIYRWSEAEGASIWMQPSGYTGVAYYGKEPGSNGLTLDKRGTTMGLRAWRPHGSRDSNRSGGKVTVVDSYRRQSG